MGHSEERSDISDAPDTELHNRVTTHPIPTSSAPTDQGAGQESTDQVAAKDAAQEVFEDARGRGKEVAEKAAEQVQETVRRFRQRTADSLGKSKDQLAAQIGSVAQALYRGSEQFRRDDLGEFAEMSGRLAGQVEEAQRYLRDRDGEALLRDVGTFARQRRALFVGSLLLTGVIAARFLNAERRPERNPAPRRRVSQVRTYSREVRR